MTPATVLAEEKLARPTSFQGATLRDKLVHCRESHRYASGRTNLPANLTDSGTPETLESYQRFHLACVAWYDEMLEQLDAIGRLVG